MFWKSGGWPVRRSRSKGWEVGSRTGIGLMISREEMVWSAIAPLGRSGVGAIVPVDRAGAKAAGVMPQ
jgi:hypothetical protein